MPRLGGLARVAFNVTQRLGTPILFFRRSIALPTRTATDASPLPSRAATHGSRRIMTWLCLRSKGLSPSTFLPVSLAHV